MFNAPIEAFYFGGLYFSSVTPFSNKILKKKIFQTLFFDNLRSKL